MPAKTIPLTYVFTDDDLDLIANVANRPLDDASLRHFATDAITDELERLRTLKEGDQF
jgi:hypothetical protein